MSVDVQAGSECIILPVTVPKLLKGHVVPLEDSFTLYEIVTDPKRVEEAFDQPLYPSTKAAMERLIKANRLAEGCKTVFAWRELNDEQKARALLVPTAIYDAEFRFRYSNPASLQNYYSEENRDWARALWKAVHSNTSNLLAVSSIPYIYELTDVERVVSAVSRFGPLPYCGHDPSRLKAFVDSSGDRLVIKSKMRKGFKIVGARRFAKRTGKPRKSPAETIRRKKKEALIACAAVNPHVLSALYEEFLSLFNLDHFRSLSVPRWGHRPKTLTSLSTPGKIMYSHGELRGFGMALSRLKDCIEGSRVLKYKHTLVDLGTGARMHDEYRNPTTPNKPAPRNMVKYGFCPSYEVLARGVLRDLVVFLRRCRLQKLVVLLGKLRWLIQTIESLPKDALKTMKGYYLVNLENGLKESKSFLYHLTRFMSLRSLPAAVPIDGEVFLG